MRPYDNHTLLLYIEKKLSAQKMLEIEQALKKDAVLLSQLMELCRVNALSEKPLTEIAITHINGEEKIFTSGAVNILRRDLVQLRSLSRPMTYNLFASKTLQISLTHSEKGYVLHISGEKETSVYLKGEDYQQNFILGERPVFLKLPPGVYTLCSKIESIRLSLA